MHDRFEPLDRRAVADHALAELVAVDLAVRGRARKRRLDRRHRLALVKPMHDGIGVVHRHALLGEHFRRGRFSHAERAGETEDEHVVLPTHDLDRNPMSTFRDHALAVDELVLPQEAEQRQQRQAEDGEIVAFDPLEQMNADALELIAADAGQRRRPPTMSR